MATYYAKNVTGTWAATSSWSATGSGGADSTGPPVAGDTAIFDSGFTGTITLGAAAACATITCQSGAAGTLSLSSYTLTVTADITFVSTMTFSGSGILTWSGAGTLTGGGISGSNYTGEFRFSTGNKTVNSDGTTWAFVLITSSVTVTMASDFQAGTLYITAGNAVMAGGYSITCATFQVLGGTLNAQTFTLVSGYRLNVTTGMHLGGAIFTGGTTIKSSSGGSVAYLAYTGTDATTVKVCRITFTDINFSTYSTPVATLDNWYGSTTGATVGIASRTSADL